MWWRFLMKWLWPFGRKLQVIGEEIGEATVTDCGQRIIHLHFFPATVSVVFLDVEPERPGCPPMEADFCEIDANGKMLMIRWHVNEPRQIRWVAKS